jgi:hypothetical protein
MIPIVKLFVSGIPGTGKTFFGNKLRDEFGFTHINLELGMQGILRQYYRDDLRRFLEEMSQCSRRFVATWGFPMEPCLSMVERLAGSDFRLVWFDGNREFAVKQWFQGEGEGKGSTDDTAFRRQVAAIEGCMKIIKPLFSRDWIDVFSTEGVSLSCGQILDRLSVSHLGITD